MNVSEMLAKPSTAIAEYSPTAAALAGLRERLANVAYDVSTTKGLDVAKRDRAEVRDLRVSLEKKRVELKAPALERSRLIDAEAKRITAELEELEKPIDQQIKAEEARKDEKRKAAEMAEIGRVLSIMEAIGEINMAPALLQRKSAEFIAAELGVMRDAVLDASVYQEMLPQAKEVHIAAIAKVELLLKAKRHDEAESAKMAAERAELEQLRAAAAGQRRKDEAAAKAADDETARVERERLAAEIAAQREQQTRLDAEAAAVRKEADRVAAVERAEAQAKHEASMTDKRGAPNAYLLAKLEMILPLFQEARDALTEITEEQRKRQGISPTLADRMDAAGTYSIDDWRLAGAIDVPGAHIEHRRTLQIK